MEENNYSNLIDKITSISLDESIVLPRVKITREKDMFDNGNDIYHITITTLKTEGHKKSLVRLDKSFTRQSLQNDIKHHMQIAGLLTFTFTSKLFKFKKMEEYELTEQQKHMMFATFYIISDHLYTLRKELLEEA